MRRPKLPRWSIRGRSLSYRELDRLSNRVAHALVRRGVKPDDRIGLHLGRSLDMVVGVLGVLKAGAAMCRWIPFIRPTGCG